MKTLLEHDMRQEFLDAILASPADVTPRMIYADWLTEEGNPLGELIRTMEHLREHVRSRRGFNPSSWMRFEELVKHCVAPHVRQSDFFRRPLIAVLHGLDPVSLQQVAIDFALSGLHRAGVVRGFLYGVVRELRTSIGGELKHYPRVNATGPGNRTDQEEQATRAVRDLERMIWHGVDSRQASMIRGVKYTQAVSGFAIRAVEDNLVGGRIDGAEWPEGRWQIFRAVEYWLGFVPPLPTRIQRQRTKGWRMPPNTVYVGRPSEWENPLSGLEAVPAFRAYCCPRVKFTRIREGSLGAVEVDRRTFRAEWVSRRLEIPPITELVIPPLDPSPLRGKNVACWCPLDKPCHGDVLIELANL